MNSEPGAPKKLRVLLSSLQLALAKNYSRIGAADPPPQASSSSASPNMQPAAVSATVAPTSAVVKTKRKGSGAEKGMSIALFAEN
jgi:hypothetical protein